MLKILLQSFPILLSIPCTTYFFFMILNYVLVHFFSTKRTQQKKKARNPIPMNMKLAHLYFMIFWRSNNKLINMRMHKIFINMLHFTGFFTLFLHIFMFSMKQNINKQYKSWLEMKQTDILLCNGLWFWLMIWHLILRRLKCSDLHYRP